MSINAVLILFSLLSKNAYSDDFECKDYYKRVEPIKIFDIKKEIDIKKLPKSVGYTIRKTPENPDKQIKNFKCEIYKNYVVISEFNNSCYKGTSCAYGIAPKTNPQNIDKELCDPLSKKIKYFQLDLTGKNGVDLYDYHMVIAEGIGVPEGGLSTTVYDLKKVELVTSIDTESGTVRICKDNTFEYKKPEPWHKYQDKKETFCKKYDYKKSEDDWQYWYFLISLRKFDLKTKSDTLLKITRCEPKS